MEELHEVVIVGAGIAGLATALGLHRQGIGSLVLESSESLRSAGFAFTTWMNAWKALDALGVGHSLRQKHIPITRRTSVSITTGKLNSEVAQNAKGKCGDHELRCVKRQVLMETLAKELPSGTIRYSSKVVSIEESRDCHLKLLHLSDGSIIKAKVLIGCDGVNSIVAKWLGLKKADFTGRHAIRGYAEFEDGHGLEPTAMMFLGGGVRIGYLPCDEKTVYWFLTWVPTVQEQGLEEQPAEMKKFVLGKLRNADENTKAIVMKTRPDFILSSPLRYRQPWAFLFSNISRGNVCVAGDALNPMTPDLGQGGCIALESGVILARCLGEALLPKKNVGKSEGGEEEYTRIRKGLERYAKERRWRAFDVIASAWLVGFIQQNDGMLINFLRERLLGRFTGKLPLKKADFDCGKLSASSGQNHE